MEIEGNTVVRDGIPVAEFDGKYKKTYLVEGLTPIEKAQIGKAIAKVKRDEEAALSKEQPKDSSEPVSKPEPVVTPKPQGVVAADRAPWEIWPDCPKPGPDGDKTEEVVEWLYANHRDYYEKRYSQRKTCIEARLANERRTWLNMGEDYAGRGMHISDCPNYATAQQAEYFRMGYRRYLEQTPTR